VAVRDEVEAGSPPGIVSVPEGVLLQHVADETVLLHLESGVYFGLDPVGTRMLDLACELADVGAITDQLVTEYDTTSEVLHRDLERLLADMTEKGLVVRCDDPAERTLSAGEPAPAIGEEHEP